MGSSGRKTGACWATPRARARGTKKDQEQAVDLDSGSGMQQKQQNRPTLAARAVFASGEIPSEQGNFRDLTGKPKRLSAIYVLYMYPSSGRS